MPIKSLLFIILVPMILAGCGGGTSSNSTNVATKLAASQGCINCHGTRLSPGTGAVIAQEWLASTHSTQNAAGCADCHEPDSGHPNLCNKCHAGGGYGVTKNPDQAGKCGKCHGLSHPQDIMMTLSPKHFGNLTASTNNSNYRASYMSSNYVGGCRKCHNPHDPSSAHQINADWAASGHGNVTRARINYEFKTRGTYEPVNLTFQYFCVRCHTTTGYINFVNSGFTNQRPFAGPGFAVVQNMPHQVAPGLAQPADAPSPDKTKEVTGCDACHDDGNGRAYGYKVRAVAAAKIYYNFSSANSSPTIKLNDNAVQYPDAGDSNLCIVCHTGRGIGRMVHDAAALGMDFSNTNGPSSHDRVAGGSIFQKAGYEFAGRDYSNPGFQHDQTGMSNFNGTGTHGPCVGCHMATDNTHSFEPVTLDGTGQVTAITSRACVKCHVGGAVQLIDVPGFTARKAGYAAALAVFNAIKTGKIVSLPNKNSNYNAAYPGGGANTMGANFNYGFLTNELGAFVHNPLYTKRLIWDSIDWLDNGALDNDVVAAINSLPISATVTAAKKAAAVTWLTTAEDGTLLSGRP